MHWASDVFFGATIGTFVGKTLSRIHKNDTSSQNIIILPIIDKDKKMLVAALEF